LDLVDDVGDGDSGGVGWGTALTEKRAAFLRLVRQGVSNSEACRQVGINRRTGTRWRYGRTILNRSGTAVHYPAVIRVPELGHDPHDDAQRGAGRYLTERERVTIADLHREGMSVRAIATDLGRTPSTVSRELRRHRDQQGRYRPHTAHQAAAVVRARPRGRRVSRDEELRQVVQAKLTNAG